MDSQLGSLKDGGATILATKHSEKWKKNQRKAQKTWEQQKDDATYPTTSGELSNRQVSRAERSVTVCRSAVSTWQFTWLETGAGKFILISSNLMFNFEIYSLSLHNLISAEIDVSSFSFCHIYFVVPLLLPVTYFIISKHCNYNLIILFLCSTFLEHLILHIILYYIKLIPFSPVLRPYEIHIFFSFFF